MLYNYLCEDDNTADQKNSGDTSLYEGTIYRTSNGDFYYSPDGKTIKKVPDNYLPKIKRQYDNWLKNKENPQDEAEEAARRERAANAFSKDPDEIKNDIKNDYKNAKKKQVDGEKYRGDGTKKKPSRYAGMTINPSLSEIETYMSTLLDNMLEKKKKKIRKTAWAFDYGAPDPMEEIDSDIRMPAWHLDPVDKEIEKEASKPYVFVYLDRSGSFQNPACTKFDQDVLDMFRKYEVEDKIYLTPLWFDQNVYEYDIGDRGVSNNGNNIAKDIKERTEGKQANVVVVTDGDLSDTSINVKVNGNVWCIFFGAISADFKDHVRGTLDNKQFFFTKRLND